MAEEAQEYDGTGKMPSFSHIKNKHKRQELYQSAKKTKRRVQLQTRMQRKKLELAHPELKAERLAKNIPRTVENSKTWVGLDEDGQVLDARTAPVQLIPQNPNTADDNEQVAPDSEKFKLNMAGLEDLFPEEQHMHFDPTTQPEASSSAHPTPSSPTKVLITTTPKPSKQLMTFLDELQSLLGGQRHAEIVPRKNSRFQISKVSNWAAKRGYGALLVVGEDHKQPSSLTLSKLPVGPTAHFRLTSVQLSRDISGHAAPTPHAPELVLSNMSTPLGLSVGRLLQTLFPPLPQLQGRQVVAVHNQRDFIFFRRFRYMFALRESEAGIARAKAHGMDEQVRTRMQEIGPRMTLKLRWIKKGTLASGRLRANGRLIGGEDEGKVEGEGDEEDEDAEAVIEDEAASQLEKDAPHPAPTSTQAYEIPEADVDTPTSNLDGNSTASDKRDGQKGKRKRQAEDIRIPKSQYAPRESYQHRVKKPKKGGSILDGVNFQGGMADQNKEWAWKPKMQIKKNRFFL